MILEKIWVLVFLSIFTLRNLMELSLVKGRGDRHDGQKRGLFSLLIFTGVYFLIGISVAWTLWFHSVILPLFMVGSIAFLGLHLLRSHLVKKVLRESYSFYTKPLEQASLRVSGPYGMVRHPVYVVYSLEILSLCLIAPNPFSFFGWVIILVGTLLRIRGEEEFLVQKYGQKYLEYKERVPMFLPTPWKRNK